MRPKQWTKNILVFSALIFSKNLFHFPLLLETTLVFVLFCLASGTVYLINDILDIEKDRLHPKKRKRPLPSGKIGIKTAISAAMVSGFGSIIASFLLNIQLGFVISAYILLILLYSLFFKKVVIIDVLTIAIGFVLRAVSGAVVIDVEISPWLLVCTFLLALFLALSKRRNELIILEDASHRDVLSEYSPELLDQMISVVTATTVIAYALYTFDERTYETFGTRNLIYTIPFVVYGIYRYLYLVHKRNLGGSPEIIFLTDRGMIADILLWIFSVGIIVYIG